MLFATANLPNLCIPYMELNTYRSCIAAKKEEKSA